MTSCRDVAVSTAAKHPSHGLPARFRISVTWCGADVDCRTIPSLPVGLHHAADAYGSVLVKYESAIRITSCSFDETE